MDARVFMYTLGPDEKATLVMLYTPSMLARGELVTKQHIRVNMWLRSAGLPNYIHLHKAEVLVFGGGAPKPLTYAEIFVPAVQVSGFHLVPPATEPLDYDVNEANRAMHPMSLLLGSFVIKGKIRVSTQIDMASSLDVLHTAWLSVYEAEISNPLLPQFLLQVPMLLVNPTHVSLGM